MSLLGNLIHGAEGLVGIHQQQRPQPQAQGQAQIPLGQSIPRSAINSFNPQTRQLAQIYNQNPMDPRVAHIDPAMFGYAPDNIESITGSIGQQFNPYSQGIAIQGVQNPGATPGQMGGYATQVMPGQIDVSGQSLGNGTINVPRNPYQRLLRK